MANSFEDAYFGDNSSDESQPSNFEQAYFPAESINPGPKYDPNIDISQESANFDAGFVHGLKKLPSLMAQGGARAIDYMKGGNLLAPMIEQGVDQENKLYDSQYGNNPDAGYGAHAGNFVASLPALGTIGKAGSAIAEGGNALLQGTRLGKFALSGINGSLQGAGFGAVNPLDSKDSLADRTKEGAEWSGALGVAVPAAYAGGKLIMQSLQGSKDFGPSQLLNAIKADGFKSIQEAENHLKSLGPEATFADLGPNSMRLARRATLMPSAGQTVIQQSLQDRQAGQSSRIMDSLLKNMGVGKSYYSTLDALNQQRQTVASPLYQQAFKQNPSIQSKEIDQILETPAGKEALSTARTMMQNDRSLMGTPDAELGEQARDAGLNVPGGVASGLNLRSLHYTKMALDDKYAGLVAQGKNSQAGIVAGLRRDLNNAIMDADDTGLYKKANEAYAGPSQSSDALENGRNSLNKPPEVIKKELSLLSSKDKELYRMGAAQRIDEMVNPKSLTSDTKNAVERIKANPKQLSELFPDQNSADSFANDVNSERTFYRTQNGILANSNTAQKLSEGAEPVDRFDQAVQLAKHAAALKSGNLLSPMVSAGRSVANKISGLNPEKSEALAKLMFSNNSGTTFNRLNAYGAGNNSLLSQYMDALASNNGFAATEGTAVNGLLNNGSSDR